jgi:hypothetical protein
MIRGIDVSHYQGSVNWASLVATHRLSFGAAKCSEGMSFVDSQFKRNWAGMKAAGIRRIAYHYASPGSSSAKAQAARFVALVNPQPGDGLCLDLEKSTLNQVQSNAWMQSFGDALRDLAPEAVTFAYLGGYSKNGTGSRACDHFDRWWYPRYASMNRTTSWETDFIPRLDTNTTGWSKPHIWQWTPNLAGMDANVSPLTVSQLFTREDNMPTAAEIWAEEVTVTGLDGKPKTATAGQWMALGNIKSGQARDNSAMALAILNGSNPAGLEAFAAALAAKFPAGAGPSAEAIAAAVRQEFSTALGGTS